VTVVPQQADPNHRSIDTATANLSLGPRDELESLKNIIILASICFSPSAALPPTPHTIVFVGMGSFNEKSDEKRVSVDSQEVDTGAQLDASLHAPLDPAEALRIRWVRVRRNAMLHLQFTVNEGGK
jgi:hypothetical protein